MVKLFLNFTKYNTNSIKNQQRILITTYVSLPKMEVFILIFESMYVKSNTKMKIFDNEDFHHFKNNPRRIYIALNLMHELQTECNKSPFPMRIYKQICMSQPRSVILAKYLNKKRNYHQINLRKIGLFVT